MTGRTMICDTNPTRCDRHPHVALHGYPCYACQQEWARRSPRVRAQIAHQASGKGAVVTPAQVTAAQKADAAAFAAYDGPHDVDVERAGVSGPVSRRWNALCVPECGWSHYWLPSRSAACLVGRDHLDEHAGAPAPRWTWDPCEVCGAAQGADCTALRGKTAGRPLANSAVHAGRRSRRTR